MGAIHTFVAAAVWGTGTGARGRERSAKVLDGDLDDVGRVLVSAVDALRCGDAIAAYTLLHDQGNRIRYLGPSFGTKFLYFAGYHQTPSDKRRPLILDENVATAMAWLCAVEWRYPWTHDQYSAYLDLAHGWAHQWGTEPDVVERVLFAVGQSRPLAVSCLTGIAATPE